MRLALISLVGAAALAGCASTAQAPDWFAQRSAADDSSYPSLRDVPRTTTANTDAAHWAELQAELVQAGQEMRANPRSEPATAAQDPNAFLNEARDDIEQARQAHED